MPLVAAVLESDALGVGIAVVGAAFVALQLLILMRQSRFLEVSVLTEVMEEWREVRERWNLALMVLRGSGYGFTDVDRDLASEYQTYLTERKAAEKAYSGERTRANLDTLVAARRKVYDFERHVRESLRSLSTISSLILSGRLSVKSAYQILGTELIRQGRILREQFSETLGPAGYFVGYYPGVQRRVMLLVDMMWAEAARLSDLKESELRMAREAKLQGSGQDRRALLRREARLLGGWLVALKLGRHAIWSEVRQDNSLFVRRMAREWRWFTSRLGR